MRARRITALRALALLRELDEKRYLWLESAHVIDHVRRALDEHVRAEITRKRRTARK